MIGAEFKIYPRAVENEIPYNLIDGIFEIEKKIFLYLKVTDLIYEINN